MKDFRFFVNEKDVAEKIINKGFTNSEFGWYEAFLVAKYFRNTYGYKDAKTKTELIKFSKEHDKNFNDIIEHDKIVSAVRESKKNIDWIVKEKEIIITKSEMEKIRSVKNVLFQRIVLTFLVFAKRHNGYVYKNKWTQIKKILGGNLTEKDIYQYIHMARNKELLRDSNQNVFVKFIDNDSEPVIKLKNDSDIINLMKSFKDYVGGDFGYCKECGIEFIKDTNHSIFCIPCSNKRNKNRWRKNKK